MAGRGFAMSQEAPCTSRAMRSSPRCNDLTALLRTATMNNSSHASRKSARMRVDDLSEPEHRLWEAFTSGAEVDLRRAMAADQSDGDGSGWVAPAHRAGRRHPRHADPLRLAPLPVVVSYRAEHVRPARPGVGALRQPHE
jgi:hypothetical protein